MSHLPADRKRMDDPWQLVDGQLKAAAGGGDVDQLAMTLRLVLSPGTRRLPIEVLRRRAPPVSLPG